MMILFALATILPVGLIAAAALFGGLWVVAALVYMTVFAAALDEGIPWIAPAGDDRAYPAAEALNALLAIAHFVLLALSVAALSGPGPGPLAKVGLFFAAGIFFGQVSNANAHELIHRGNRWLHRLGEWVYISLLFGHHTSAHVLIHHRYAGTPEDPNTSRLGESYYHFARRAWIGSFRTGLKAETARIQRANRPLWRHPYLRYVIGGAVVFTVVLALGGPVAAFWFWALAVFAQGQLLMSDYVQHYGLSRQSGDMGRESWNSPHWFSSALMLNAPRHSDHHAYPGRQFPALRLPEVPMLPHALPIMACIALFPRRWRRTMDPLAAKWA